MQQQLRYEGLVCFLCRNFLLGLAWRLGRNVGQGMEGIGHGLWAMDAKDRCTSNSQDTVRIGLMTRLCQLPGHLLSFRYFYLPSPRLVIGATRHRNRNQPNLACSRSCGLRCIAKRDSRIISRWGFMLALYNVDCIMAFTYIICVHCLRHVQYLVQRVCSELSKCRPQAPWTAATLSSRLPS